MILTKKCVNDIVLPIVLPIVCYWVAIGIAWIANRLLLLLPTDAEGRKSLIYLNDEYQMYHGFNFWMILAFSLFVLLTIYRLLNII